MIDCPARAGGISNRYAYVKNNPLSAIDPSGFGDEDTATDCQSSSETRSADCGGHSNEGGGASDTPWIGDMDVLGDRITFPDPRYLPIDTSARDIPRDEGPGGNGTAGGTPGNRLSCSAASTTSSAEQDVLIQLAYIDANASGRSIGNQNHAFVIAIDRASGRMYASRGGPGSGPGGGAAHGATDFVAVSGPLNNRFPDRLSEVHSVQTVGYVRASFGQVVGYMNALATVTNSNGLSYLGPVQNSNSYAFTLVEGFGFERPSPAVPAMGNATNSVDPQLTCTNP